MKPAADHPLQLVLGLTVWSVWFIAVYAGVSVPCAAGPSPEPDGGPMPGIGAVLGLATVATAATAVLLAAAAGRCARHARRLRDTTGVGGPVRADADGADAGGPDPATRRFVATVAAALHLTAAIATVVVGLPLLVVPPCV